MKWPRHTRAIAIGLGFVAAQALLVVVYRGVERGRHAATEPFRSERLPARPAPELELLALDGAQRRLSELRGKPVLLHFWATWCWPCRDELPGLLELADELQQQGDLRFVALSLDDDWDAVRTFFDGEVPASVLRDASGKAAAQSGVSVLPDTYLLDAEGNVRVRFGGARDWTTEAARRALTAALTAKD